MFRTWTRRRLAGTSIGAVRKDRLWLLPALCLLLFSCTASVSSNELAVGEQSKEVGAVDIGLNMPRELDGMSKKDILNTRTSLVSLHPELLVTPYEPFDSVFGMIVDGKPWWGMSGSFVWGVGERSSDGPSEESRFIYNPFLLVGANPWSAEIWNEKSLDAANLESPDFPFTWLPSLLRYHPRRQAIQIVYDVSNFNQRLASHKDKLKDTSSVDRFGLVGYNARDFGYEFIQVSEEGSRNIEIPKDGRHPTKIDQFIHCGGSSGVAGGCNNMSPARPPFDELVLTDLPALAKIFLWKENPGSRRKQPDLTVYMHFR